MLRLSPTLIMPGSYPSPTMRTQTSPTPVEVPVWASPVSDFAHLSRTESPPAISLTPSPDEGQRARSQSSHRAPARMSIRYTSSTEALNGAVSPSGSSFSLYRAPSRMSFRKRDYTVDDEEVEGEVSGSGASQSPHRAPERMSIRRGGYTIDVEDLGGEASGSGSSQSPNRVLTRMPIRRRSYMTGTEALDEEARQSSNILSGSESPQSTGDHAGFDPPSRTSTPFMLNTFISMANQYAKTSQGDGRQQGLTFKPGREGKDPSASHQPYQPSYSHQGSNSMSDEHDNLGHQISAAATKKPNNTNITKWPGPVNRTSTPFPHGAKYNTSPARLQRVPTTQDPVSPIPTPRSLPYQYDVSQDPFRDSFSGHPLTLDRPSSASSASSFNPPPKRHDSPSSTTLTLHPGFGNSPPTDPIPYPHIRSSPLYKGPPELKHLAPSQPPRQKPISGYYEPRNDSFHPVQKTRPSSSIPQSAYPRAPASSPEPMFPRRPTVKSPLNQRIWLGSPESFDRLPEYTGETPSPPRERMRVRVETPKTGGEEMEGKKKWRERMEGWFKIKGRGGGRWRGKGMVRRDGGENGDKNEGGVENGISVEYEYGVEYVDGDRKGLVDRVRRKVGGGKLKERVKRIFKREERN